MSKRMKELIQEEYEALFQDVNDLLVVSVLGIGGTNNNLLREDLSSKGISLHVVKNSLACRVFESREMAGMEEVLQGPCAVVYGGDSIVDVAKILKGWAKKLELLQIKGGYLEGQSLDAEAATALSNMKSRRELQGDVVMLAQSPGRRIAGAVGSPAGRIAGCIKTLIENLEAA